MRTLIAIPVHNEQKYADRVLDQVTALHPEVLVIDDGSTDDTPTILSARGDIQVLTHRPNAGYGKSLIDAFTWAHARGYDWVITMDCDEQHEPQRIPDFLREIATDRWDIVSGSRYLRHDAGDDLPPGDRQSINAKLTSRLNDLFNFGITDAFCGYKAHRVGPTVKLGLTEAGYAFPMQLWPRVARDGLRLKEIPVRRIYNDPSRTFGGMLDDANNRYRHYTDVLDAEVAKLPAGVVVTADAVAEAADSQTSCSSCCCK